MNNGITYADGAQVRMATAGSRTGEVRSDMRVSEPPPTPAATPTTATEVALPGTRDRVVLRALPFSIRARNWSAPPRTAARARSGHPFNGAGIELSVVAVGTGLVTGTLTKVEIGAGDFFGSASG